MIPGHRFIPFYYTDLFPFEFTIVDILTEKPLAKKKTSQPIESLFEYYYMFGADTIKDHLASEDKSNLKVIGKDTRGTVKISAFDLKAIQKSHKLKSFNLLILEVVDWTNGIFTAEICDVEPPVEMEKTYMFAEEIESSLYKVFEKFGPYHEVPEQLAWAYFIADAGKVKDPQISLEDIIGITENIELKYFENNTVLWYKSDDGSSWHQHHSRKDKEPFAISSGSTASIDSIFDDLKHPFTSRDIALFLNLCSSKYKNCSEFIVDILPSKLSFKDKAQGIIFHNLMEELFENLKTDAFALNDGKHEKIIHNGIDRLKNISRNYPHEPLSAKHSNEDFLLKYRDMKEKIDTASSVLSYYCNSPHSFQETEQLLELEKYINELLISIETLLPENKNHG